MFITKELRKYYIGILEITLEVQSRIKGRGMLEKKKQKYKHSKSIHSKTSFTI